MEVLLDAIKDQPLALVAFGVVLAVIFGVRYLGLWQGQHSGPKNSAGSAQVAAVIVDPTALNAAAGEVAGLAVALEQGVVALRGHTAATDRLSEKIDTLQTGVDQLRTELIRAAATR